MASGSGDGGSSSNADIPRGLINRTGNPIGKGSRLPSVRGHRDLTLGGIQRKVFTPNLAAVKRASSKDDVSKPNTPTTPSSSQERQESGKGKGRGKSDRGRGRGRGQAEDRTIQLQSEFAYGPMGGKGSSSSGWSRGREGGGGGGEGGGGGKGGGSDSGPVKSSMRTHQNTEEDRKVLDSLMRDDFVSDLSAGDPNMAPIQLPLTLNKGAVGAVKYEVKSEVKAEAMDVDEVDARHESKPNPVQTRSHQQGRLSPPTVKEIFDSSAKSEKGEILFFQFPDSLPGLPASALDDRPRTSGTSMNSGDTKQHDEVLNRLSACHLKDCNEGYMGKLRIRKSGKAELVLGDNVMEVLPGIPINFHQELVSIRTEDNPGQMVVLGPVNHKLVVTPDYNQLLAHINKFS